MSSGENLTINDSPIINSPLTSSPLLSAPLSSTPSNVRYSSGLYYNGVKYEWGKHTPLPDYLCFEGETSTASVSLKKTGNPTSVQLETSTNGTTWSDYTIGTDISLGIGGKIYIRNKSETTTSFSTSSSNYYYFQMGGHVKVSGDINYLINKNSTTTLVSSFCFVWLFNNCTAIQTVPKLTATTLTDRCYLRMFNGCTRLNKLPTLPALILQPYCYGYMFTDCSSIKLSTKQTGEYQTPYRIPTTGTGITTSYWNDSMFKNTGGTFTSNPSINTTYYTSNTVV